MLIDHEVRQVIDALDDAMQQLDKLAGDRTVNKELQIEAKKMLLGKIP